MSLFKASVLMTSLVLSAPTTFANNEKIVGGEPVKDLAEAPYMVSLGGSWGAVCGGSIISSKWILTAAHCVGYYKNAKIGVLNLSETGKTYTVKRSIKHPEYAPSNNSHDYALVELNEEINFAKTKAKAVLLASPEFEAEGHSNPGIDSTVYGWGNTDEGQSNASKDLMKVVVPLVSNEEANHEDAYNGGLDDSMIAAGYAAGGKDSCQGDSGGPLVVFDANNAPVQVGVVSWGEGCARANKYGVYSRVSKAYEWIQTTMAGK